MKNRWRNLLVLVIAVACIIATFQIFSWRGIVGALKQTNAGILLVGGGSMLALAIFVRGLRWLLVLGAPITTRSLFYSTLANGAASGLATITPLQAGEAMKVRFMPESTPDNGWRHGVSGFIVERVMDMGSLVGIGLSGLAAHFGHAWLMPLFWLTPLACGLTLSLLSTHVNRAPERFQPFLEAFRYRGRIVRGAIATIPLWLLNAGMWWFAVAAINVRLDLPQLCILLGGVMLATIASMIPSGVGASEISTRGIMLWLGFDVASSEAAAIGLRLLTPLIVLSGAICLFLLAIFQRQDRQPRTIDTPRQSR